MCIYHAKKKFNLLRVADMTSVIKPEFTRDYIFVLDG